MSKELENIKRGAVAASPVIVVGGIGILISVAAVAPFVTLLLTFIALMCVTLGSKATCEYLSRPREIESEPKPAKAWYMGGGNVIEPTPELSIYDCAVYDQSQFDRRMVEGGVMKADEIATCDVHDCPNCQPERLRRAEAMKLARREERRKIAKELDEKKVSSLSTDDAKRVQFYQRDELARMGREARMQMCQRCKEFTFFETHCPSCLSAKFKESRARRAEQEKAKREAEAARAKAAAIAEAKREAAEIEAKKIVRFKGITVRRPEQVPDGADPEIVEDVRWGESYIVWRWFADGKPMFLKQMVVTDFYEVHSDSRTGAVAKWTAVYDPDTNEHLGDYRVVNGETKVRNPQPQKPQIVGHSISVNNFSAKELEEKEKYLKEELIKDFDTLAEMNAHLSYLENELRKMGEHSPLMLRQPL